MGPNDTAKTLIYETLFSHPEIKNLETEKFNKKDTFIIKNPREVEKYEKYSEIKVIVSTRDPRIGWLITEHKKYTKDYQSLVFKDFPHRFTLDFYIQRYNTFLNVYKDYHILKTEDLIKKPHQNMKKIFDFCQLKYKREYLWKEFKPFNDYISLYDFERIFRYRHLININELERITEECSDYLEKFGYDKTIDIDKWLYPYKLEKNYEI